MLIFIFLHHLSKVYDERGKNSEWVAAQNAIKTIVNCVTIEGEDQLTVKLLTTIFFHAYMHVN